MTETSDVIGYPPLTPLAELPLHPEAHWLPGQWWACEHPERPHDDDTRYDWRCEKCVIGAEASLHHGDIDMDWRPSEHGEPVVKKLSWHVARSKTLLGEHDDRPKRRAQAWLKPPMWWG